MAPFLAVIGIAILFRLLAGRFDGRRVEGYIRSMGYELIDRSWDPFGPGWFGEKKSRIYQIVYRDGNGNTYQAHVKTSMFSGVYLTNERLIESRTSQFESVEEEKRRLRKRLSELE